MLNLARTPFGAIFYNEVRLNSQRVMPYALLVLFSAQAVLWWGWSAAAHYGWATNGDFNIVRNLQGFSFLLGLPIFNALIMGDPVIRDFRTGVDPLIFSKPVSRASYLLGKFCGNFFVLVCCQAAFALTMLLLQWFPKQNLVVQPARVFPYFKHFFFFVVVSHLVLAAIYFTVGTLTRNARIVYALAVSFYPLYIAYQLLCLKPLPPRWRIALDPMLMSGANVPRPLWENANLINQIVVGYDAAMIANRALMLLCAALCLTLLYFRFRTAGRSRRAESFSTLNLSTGVDRLYDDSESMHAARPSSFEVQFEARARREKVSLPEVAVSNEGGRANFSKLRAALGVEFRLLRAERSLVVIMPLAVFLSVLELAFYEVSPDVSYTAAYASSSAKSLLLFLFGVTVFYTGEAIHRDREVRIEPLLWSVPAANYVSLVSKFLAPVVLGLSLLALVALAAIALQIYKGHAPVEFTAYLLVYSLILFPGVVFIAAASVLLNVSLRDKYLAYAVSITIGGGLFYLYNRGYNHWFYNPLLYQLWTYADLTGAGSNGARILAHRIYFLAIACACLALAHLFHQRRTTKGFRVNNRLASAGWSILVAAVSVLVAVVAGFLVIRL